MQTLCCQAYNVLRKNANLLITLFFLMLSCGIPELQTASDLEWLVDKLMVRACVFVFVCVCARARARVCVLVWVCVRVHRPV